MIVHYIDEIMVIIRERARVVSVRYTDDKEQEIKSMKIHSVKHIASTK